MTMYIAGSGLTFPDTSQQTTAGIFAPGTLMLFQQTAAPTGWTKQTTHDNKALRIVSGTASSGGSVAFTTAFASGLSAEATTLTTTQIPSHQHSLGVWSAYTGSGPHAVTLSSNNNEAGTFNTATGFSGSGGSHAHTLPSFAVSYVDIIIASKN